MSGNVVSISGNVVSSCETRVAKVLLSLDKSVVPESSSGPGTPRGVLRQYCPSELLSGCVTVQLEYKQFVRGIWVKLSGANLVLNQTIDGVKKKIIADVLSDEPDHYCGGLHQVLLGLGEEPSTEVNYNDLLELDAGSHVFPFSIAIPAGAPLTYCDENCSLAYNLDALLDSPSVSNASSTVSTTIVVGGISEELYIETLAQDNVLGSQTTTSDYRIQFTNSVSDLKKLSCAYNFLRSSLGYPAAHVSVECLSGPSVFEFTGSGASYIKMKYGVSKYAFKKDVVIRTELLSNVVLYRRRKVNDKVQLCQVGSYSHPIFSLDKTISKHSAEAQAGCLSVDIPIRVDSSQRLVCLSEWPRPSPLAHGDNDGFINHFTTSGPLFTYKVLVKVSVFKRKDRRGVAVASVSSALGSDALLQLVGEPLVKEVTIKPPKIPTAPNSVVNMTPHVPRVETRVVPTSRPPLAPSGAAVFSTPNARVALPCVAAEALSLGPAAVLMDRQNSSRGTFRTPSRFATMYRLVQDAAIAYAIAPSAADTPQYSPAMASVYIEEDVCSSAAENEVSSDNVCIPVDRGVIVLNPTPQTAPRNRVINASNIGDGALGGQVAFSSAYISDDEDDGGNDENDRLAANTSGSYRVWQTPTQVLGLASSLRISTSGDQDTSADCQVGAGEQMRRTSPVYGAASIATQLFQ